MFSGFLSVNVFAAEAPESGVTLQSTGYDLHPLEGNMTMTMFTDHTNVQWSAVVPDGGNVYTFSNVAQASVDQLTFSAIAGQSYGFDVLINQSLYDYYFVVTVFADNSTNADFTFYPTYMSCQTYPCDVGSKWYGFQDITTKHFDTITSRGYTIIGRLNSQITSSRVVQVSMSVRNSDLYYTVPANLRFKCNVIEVPKNAVTSADIQSIIGKIDEQTDVIVGSIEDAADQIADQIENQYSGDPSSEFDVNDIITQHSEKMGVLSFGSDVMLQFLDMFQSANVGTAELTLPGFNIAVAGVDYAVWPDYSFNFEQLNDWVPALMSVIRVILPAFVWLMVLRYCIKVFEDNFLAK